MGPSTSYRSGSPRRSMQNQNESGGVRIRMKRDVKCQLEALDEDIIYDYLPGFSVSNDERILIIMVQEYVAYEQLQANYFDHCE
ncbi:hypothetical protein M0R45_021352 [Rubus argutus]|uniref:Uncharacterized protein n=1 Tax=Rubus argutus TaxID=59490 RepID=A0AAW1XEP2_RUBAR